MIGESSRRWWETRAFAVLAICAMALPLLWPTIPPLTDLPGHIGRYRVMLGTDSATLSQWYAFHWRLVGNLGVDLLVAALAPVFGLEPAVKLVIITIPVLTATGILWIARETHGRVTPLALFALPLAYNFPFNFGFVNYSLAMALALNAFALWLRLGRQERLRLRALLFVPISGIVWLCHVMGWGALGLLVFGAEAVRQREAGRRWIEAFVRAAIDCLPLALPLLPLLAWRSESGGQTNRFFTMLKLGWLAEVFRDRWFTFDFCSTLLLAALLYKGVRDRRFGHSPALVGALLALFAAFLLLPFMLFGSAYADMRLAPYLAMLALLSMYPRDAVGPRERAFLALVGLAFFAARLAGTTASYWLYDRSYTRHLAALDHVPRGARLGTFIGENCFKDWAQTRLNHLPGMAIARRAAFSNDQWRLEGGALLKVTATGMHDFRTDPSQMVLVRACDREPGLISLNDSLRTLPRGSFDYVWLIDPPEYDHRLLAGMKSIWRDGSSALYRVAPQARLRESPKSP